MSVGRRKSPDWEEAEFVRQRSTTLMDQYSERGSLPVPGIELWLGKGLGKGSGILGKAG